MKTRTKKTDWKGQAQKLKDDLAGVLELKRLHEAGHVIALGAAYDEKDKLTAKLQEAHEAQTDAEDKLDAAVSDWKVMREELYAKERELAGIRKELESLVCKGRRSADVSAVLAAFLLTDNSEMGAVKKFIALADQMGLEKVEEMHEHLQKAFRRAGEEVHKRAFAKVTSSGLASVMAKILGGGSLEIGDLAGLRQ